MVQLVPVQEGQTMLAALLCIETSFRRSVQAELR